MSQGFFYAFQQSYAHYSNTYYSNTYQEYPLGGNVNVKDTR